MRLRSGASQNRPGQTKSCYHDKACLCLPRRLLGAPTPGVANMSVSLSGIYNFAGGHWAYRAQLGLIWSASMNKTLREYGKAVRKNTISTRTGSRFGKQGHKPHSVLVKQPSAVRQVSPQAVRMAKQPWK